MAVVLEVHDLEKSFGGVVAAHNINVVVEEGETVGVIGANGAGKTTFINMVTGWLRPSGRTIQFDGRSLLGKSPRDIERHTESGCPLTRGFIIRVNFVAIVLYFDGGFGGVSTLQGP